MAARAKGTSLTFGLSLDVKEARERFERCEDRESLTRANYLEDTKFANADPRNNWQWDLKIYGTRTRQRKPCLTVNMVRQHNLQIINDAKKNKPSIKIRATGGGASAESAQDLQALVKYIERNSRAAIAYDVATETQVNGGIGYWRVITEYADDQSFDQDIIIQPIYDPLTVYMDPSAQERDKSDANFAFIFEDVPNEELETRYPEYKGDFEVNNVVDKGDNWRNSKTTRVCEYYRKRSKKLTLFVRTTTNGQEQVVREDALPKELASQLRADETVRSREVMVERVERLVIIGNKRVGKVDEWPGKYIPIVPVIGEEYVIEGKLYRKGHTRNLLDAQRMYNYWSPLSIDTLVPTSYGWTTMGEIQEGDQVFDEKGEICSVVGLSPVMYDRNCFKITFDDGSSVISDAEHKWTVEERGKRKASSWSWTDKTVTTAELKADKHFLCSPPPLNGEEESLPLDPYLLGMWLGDGTTAAPRITSSLVDLRETMNNIAACGYAVGEPVFDSMHSAGTFAIYGLTQAFEEFGLIGDKHIPYIYLRGNAKQRWNLLQGLMDADGTFNPANNSCGFTTTNASIAAGFKELLRSLGIKSKFVIRKASRRIFPNGKFYNTLPSWQFNFTVDPDDQVFRLARKSAAHSKIRNTHWRRTKRYGIRSIEAVESVPVRCITVSSENHLFLVGEAMIPTHNSAAVEYGALQTKIPWLAATEAIGDYVDVWKNANTTNLAYLPYNARDESGNDIPPPQRVEPPVATPLCLKGMEMAQIEMMRASGQFAAQMGEQGNERSGVAIAERQRQGDTSTYHFIDGLATAIRYTGIILLDLIPHIYDTERLLMAQAEDGEFYELLLDPQMKAAWDKERQWQQQTISRVLNPKVGKYEVEADVGPGYATKREEAFSAYSTLLTQAPALTNIIGDLLLQAGDFPMADEAAARLRRLVPKEALGEGPSPEVAALQEENASVKDLLKRAMEELAKAQLAASAAKADKDADMYDAMTKRLKVVLEQIQNEKVSEMDARRLVFDTVKEAINFDLKSKDAEQQRQLELFRQQGQQPTTPMSGGNNARPTQ